MISFLVVIFIIILLVLSVILSAFIFGSVKLNRYELRYKAQAGDKDAKVIFPLRQLGNQLLATLIISNLIVLTSLVAFIDVLMNGVFAVMLTSMLVIGFSLILPLYILQKNYIHKLALFAPVVKQLVVIFSFLAKPLGNLFDSWFGNSFRTIHTKEELRKAFEESNVSKESDISPDEIRIVKHALTFSDKQVRQVMIPRRAVVAISADEIMGPLVIDELHKSGHSRFPVYSGGHAQNFVGTLYLRDLVSVKESVTAKQLMKPEVFYVHEEQSLDQALRVFLKTNHHLLIVVNTFEEFVGVISLEDIIEQILGKQIIDEFDQHADLRAVAQSVAAAEKRTREEKLAKK